MKLMQPKCDEGFHEESDQHSEKTHALFTASAEDQEKNTQYKPWEARCGDG